MVRFAVYDVSDDPRIQYPEAARKEGIASILSVPITVGDNIIGGHPGIHGRKVGIYPG
jgi:GAF domain-containing protein